MNLACLAPSKPKPQIAERRSQKTMVFDVLRDARRQRRKADYSSSTRR